MNLPLYQSVEPTGDEKILALFSHLSILFGGTVLPIIFWAINKDKSRFVRFHSLQAIFFHIAYVVILFAVIIILAAVGIGLGALSAGTFAAGKDGSLFLIFAMIIFYGFIFLSVFVFIGYGIYVGVKSYKGELSRYPIIGKIIYDKVYGTMDVK
jgi:uncharacterized Tic20 family protein